MRRLLMMLNLEDIISYCYSPHYRREIPGIFSTSGAKLPLGFLSAFTA